MNPFLITGYNGPDYFCDRISETARLCEAIRNNRNLTLISERRMGKTSLLNHVKNVMGEEVLFIYLDIYPTLELKDFIQVLSSVVINRLEPFSDKVIRKITSFFSAFKPRFSFDPQTGSPNLELSFGNEREVQQSISLLFEYIRNSGQKLVIAFDEFQQILRYPEKNVEALLRSEIQKDPTTCFIFSGSQTSMLLAMFNEYSRPFYNSAETMYLEPIEKSVYKQFIVEKFLHASIDIYAETADFLYDINRGITYNVQYHCHKLFSDPKEKITIEIAEEKLSQILKENEIVYYNYRELLTVFQYQVLKAVAQVEQVEKPYSIEFINAYKLGSASSVRTAINALIDKGFLVQQNGVHLTDWYFSLWLKRKL